MGYDRFMYAMFKKDILRDRKVNHTCELCGAIVRRRNIRRHQRTIKCQKANK